MQQRQPNDTALLNAAWNGRADSVERLLSLSVWPVDVNAKDVDDLTALMLAALQGHTHIVDRLLAVPGIDVNAKDVDGLTALIVAAARGNTDSVERLLTAPDIKVNAKTKLNETALLKAVVHGRTAVVERLLGVLRLDHNATNHDGKTAFVLAKEKAAAVRERVHGCTEIQALPALMTTWIALKNWGFLCLWLRVKVMLKQWLVLPLREHQKLVRLAADDWETHDLNPNKKQRLL